MQQHLSFEKKTDYFEDTTLAGYINLINLILKKNKSILSSDESTSLLKYIIEKLLFTYENSPASTHVTSKVDLLSIER